MPTGDVKPCHACGADIPAAAAICTSCNTFTNAFERCVVCSAFMTQFAQKCTACDSYQDWRRWFTVSATVLAILTALISVIGLLFTTVTNIAGRGSSTSAAYAGVTPEYVAVGVVNFGNAPSFIRDLSLRSDPDVVTFSHALIQNGDMEKRFLKPRETAILHISVGRIEPGAKAAGPDFWSKFGNTEVTIVGRATESDGSTTRLHETTTLLQLQPFIKKWCPTCQ